ncbi:hypothetical protein C8J57DRAFT_1483347 [Mycena rebaudengoi]|nr:hypothetical protein C8J57DRAFT_1483347 [Mycena rebaudengoi]
MFPLIPVVWLALTQVSLAVQLASPDWRASVQFDIPPKLFFHMAEFDLATGQTKYRDTLQKNLQTIIDAHSNFMDDRSVLRPSIGLWIRVDVCSFFSLSAAYYGRAAIKAYAVSKQQIFLDFALSSWFHGAMYTISEQDLAKGTSPVKAYPLSTSRNDRSFFYTVSPPKIEIFVR